MKRFITVLSGLLVLPAFAEVAPVYYDEIVEYADDMENAEMSDVSESETTAVKNVAQRNNINRSTSASRAISSGNAGNTSRANTSTRAVASSPRSTTGTNRGTTARTTKSGKVVSRTPTNSRASVKSRNTATSKSTTARVGTLNNSVMPGNRTTNYGYVTELAEGTTGTLYNPTTNAARIGVANRRSTARLSTSTKTTTPTITEADISSTTNNLTALAELTDYCKAQYAACMDNYCNVLDDNQGRCSCSKNIKNYAKIEASLEAAAQEFQAATQKIINIGLTGDQIESLFTETEAEIAMKSKNDSSRLKSTLDTIKKGIVDVSTSSSSSADLTSGISFDITGLLNTDFTSGFDWTSFLGQSNSSTSSVSNQRGETLYKTAQNRCRTTVLNSCTAQGIDANVITNSYDLEIDKQCMAYERSLNEANSEMRNNISNAQYVLQRARLVLAENRNAYTLRQCVAAIDTCMQDDYVCGSDYELCLDPTGKYLSNGEIVKGGTPGVSGGQNINKTGLASAEDLNTWTSGGMYNLYSIWNYDSNKNAWGVGKSENLGGYVDAELTNWKSIYAKSKDTTKTDSMATYLLQKIGYIDGDDKVHGMCASVMKQCQDYTYKNQASNNKSYIPDNEVVRQYLNSTLAKIKVQQDAILSDYAESCRTDVQSCLSTNGYDESNTSSTASKTAVNACAAEITTCMSVGGYQLKDGVQLTLRAMSDWVASILQTCPANYYLHDTGTNDSVVCRACPLFNAVQTVSAGGQVTRCSCGDGYYDVTNEYGQLTGCSAASCPEDQYLKLGSDNKYSCATCPTASVDGSTTETVDLKSDGGTATACRCPDGYSAGEGTNADGNPTSCKKDEE